MHAEDGARHGRTAPCVKLRPWARPRAIGSVETKHREQTTQKSEQREQGIQRTEAAGSQSAQAWML